MIRERTASVNPAFSFFLAEGTVVSGLNCRSEHAVHVFSNQGGEGSSYDQKNGCISENS